VEVAFKIAIFDYDFQADFALDTSFNWSPCCGYLGLGDKDAVEYHATAVLSGTQLVNQGTKLRNI
jgi:hypothetical protein